MNGYLVSALFCIIIQCDFVRLGRLAVLARSGLEKARRIWSSQANVDNSACLNNGTDSNSDLISVLDVPIATVGDIRQMNIHSYDYEYQKANAKAVYSILCIMSMLLLGAVVMTSIEKWSFVDALYWAIVTSTTVGYGDKTPTSVGGRAFCIVYILVGTFIIAQAMAVFIHYPLLRRQRKQEFEVLEQFLNLPAEVRAPSTTMLNSGLMTGGCH